MMNTSASKPQETSGQIPGQKIVTEAPRGWLAIILGLILIPINVYFLAYMECAVRSGPWGGGGPFPSTVSLFANAVLFLTVLTVVNNYVSRRIPFITLRRTELLIIYVMLTISTAIVSIDFMDVLVPMMTYVERFAEPGTPMAESMLPFMKPGWLSVSDPAAVEAFWEGHSNMAEHLHAWVRPVMVWSGVMLVIMYVMFCINTIVRRQWMEHDKLQFPIVELPLQITEPDCGLFKNKLMWAGFAIAAGITLFNGLNFFYPSLPQLRVKMWDAAILFPNRPWNAIGWTPISFYPYGIGLSFILPLDMLFSCWFFFVMWRVIKVVAASYGIMEISPKFPYENEQALGGYMLVGLFALWYGRKHIAGVLKAAFTDHKDPNEADEPMRYRTAVFGLIIGTLIIMAFFHYVGLRWWVSVICIMLYFMLAMAISRMHSEFGPPSHDLHYIGPEMIMTGALGAGSFSRNELVGFGWFWWFNRAYRSIPIAYHMDGLKIAHRTNSSQRVMHWAMCAAAVAAVVSGFLIWIHFGCERGASAKMAGHVQFFAWEAWEQRTLGWIVSPKRPDTMATGAIGWGMAFTYFLYFMKLRAPWWPFHPLGFAVSTSYSIGTLWVPMFIAWAAKIITLKIGGLKAYRTVLFFFLGLLLGDFTMGILWPLIGWVLGVGTYSYMQ